MLKNNIEWTLGLVEPHREIFNGKGEIGEGLLIDRAC